MHSVFLSVFLGEGQGRVPPKAAVQMPPGVMVLHENAHEGGEVGGGRSEVPGGHEQEEGEEEEVDVRRCERREEPVRETADFGGMGAGDGDGDGGGRRRSSEVVAVGAGSRLGDERDDQSKRKERDAHDKTAEMAFEEESEHPQGKQSGDPSSEHHPEHMQGMGECSPAPHEDTGQKHAAEGGGLILTPPGPPHPTPFLETPPLGGAAGRHGAGDSHAEEFERTPQWGEREPHNGGRITYSFGDHRPPLSSSPSHSVMSASGQKREGGGADERQTLRAEGVERETEDAEEEEGSEGSRAAAGALFYTARPTGPAACDAGGQEEEEDDSEDEGEGSVGDNPPSASEGSPGGKGRTSLDEVFRSAGLRGTMVENALLPLPVNASGRTTVPPSAPSGGASSSSSSSPSPYAQRGQRENHDCEEAQKEGGFLSGSSPSQGDTDKNGVEKEKTVEEEGEGGESQIEEEAETVESPHFDSPLSTTSASTASFNEKKGGRSIALVVFKIAAFPILLPFSLLPKICKRRIPARVSLSSREETETETGTWETNPEEERDLSSPAVLTPASTLEDPATFSVEDRDDKAGEGKNRNTEAEREARCLEDPEESTEANAAPLYANMTLRGAAAAAVFASAGSVGDGPEDKQARKSEAARLLSRGSTDVLCDSLQNGASPSSPSPLSEEERELALLRACPPFGADVEAIMRRMMQEGEHFDWIDRAERSPKGLLIRTVIALVLCAVLFLSAQHLSLLPAVLTSLSVPILLRLVLKDAGLFSSIFPPHPPNRQAQRAGDHLFGKASRGGRGEGRASRANGEEEARFGGTLGQLVEADTSPPPSPWQRSTSALGIDDFFPHPDSSSAAVCSGAPGGGFCTSAFEALRAGARPRPDTQTQSEKWRGGQRIGQKRQKSSSSEKERLLRKGSFMPLSLSQTIASSVIGGLQRTLSRQASTLLGGGRRGSNGESSVACSMDEGIARSGSCLSSCMDSAALSVPLEEEEEDEEAEERERTKEREAAGGGALASRLVACLWPYIVLHAEGKADEDAKGKRGKRNHKGGLQLGAFPPLALTLLTRKEGGKLSLTSDLLWSSEALLPWSALCFRGKFSDVFASVGLLVEVNKSSLTDQPPFVSAVIAKATATELSLEPGPVISAIPLGPFLFSSLVSAGFERAAAAPREISFLPLAKYFLRSVRSKAHAPHSQGHGMSLDPVGSPLSLNEEDEEERAPERRQREMVQKLGTRPAKDFDHVPMCPGILKVTVHKCEGLSMPGPSSAASSRGPGPDRQGRSTPQGTVVRVSVRDRSQGFNSSSVSAAGIEAADGKERETRMGAPGAAPSFEETFAFSVRRPEGSVLVLSVRDRAQGRAVGSARFPVKAILQPGAFWGRLALRPPVIATGGAETGEGESDEEEEEHEGPSQAGAVSHTGGETDVWSETLSSKELFVPKPKMFPPNTVTPQVPLLDVVGTVATEEEGPTQQVNVVEQAGAGAGFVHVRLLWEPVRAGGSEKTQRQKSRRAASERSSSRWN